MAAPGNGRAKKGKSATPNGKANGTANSHLNGNANTQHNGHATKTKPSTAVVRSRKHTMPKKSVAGSFTAVLGRLITWYLIATVFFRCPSSLQQISNSSPAVCKPYLQARSYVAPYVDPYYQTYVTPQIKKIQPYFDRLDATAYTPVSTFTKQNYAKYGAHRVQQVQVYLEAEWDRTVRPQLQNVQTAVQAQYIQHLGPHVEKITAVLYPYYTQTKDSMLEIYHLTLLPTWEAIQPYSRQAYAYGHHIVKHIIFPYARTARDAGWSFVTRTLWPQLRVLYGANVEPQLVRIRERLGRHRDQQKMEAVVDAIESDLPDVSTTIEVSVIPSVATPPVKSSDSGWDVFDKFWGADSSSTITTNSEVETKTATRPEEPKLTGAELREKLNQDLRQWQSKFAAAADTGSEDLEERVAAITDRQVENGVKGYGAALVVQLEETARSTLDSFKKFIKHAIESLPKQASESDLEAAYEKCVAKTRELGLTVKDKAQAIRTWKVTYDQETDELVKSAVENTLEVLDRIHGLGLQEVGMRWAWTDGVTYKDWQNYHKLRNTLTEWKSEVEAVGARHDGLKVAHDEANALEDKAMDIASKMVTELVRLKDVSRWKIWADDTTDDFTNRKVPARAFKAATEAANSVEEAASMASQAIVGSETPTAESVVSVVKGNTSVAQSAVSEVVLESPQSIASVVADEASTVSSKASEAVAGSESELLSTASSVVQSVESVVLRNEKTAVDAVSSASASPKKVFGGAMASVIAEAHEIIFDDEIDNDDSETYSERLQNIVGQAGDRAADLTRAVSEALLGAGKKQGTTESVSSLASEQYERAIAAASSVLYGTEQPAIESATSVASEKFAQAVTAASYAIYGTPTPTAITKTIQAQASSRYSDAVNLANEQFSNAKSQLSLLFSGTPKPAHVTMFSMIDKAYSDSLAAASERLQAALQYTESVKNYAAGPTQGYFESVSSVAASKLSEGLSAASAQFTSQPTPALEGARRQYYEAIGLAHARYSEFLGTASTAIYGSKQSTVESLASVISGSAASVASEVSSGVYGTETPWAQSVASEVSGSAASAASQVKEGAQSLASEASFSLIGIETPWTESIASQASQNWDALIAKASNQVYGAPTPWAQSIYSQAGEYGAQATAQATQQYAAMQALISELVIGKEPDFTESVMHRFSSAYYSGIPAVVASVNSYASENLEAVSSYAGESYDAATSYVEDAYASASSVVSSIFTPPPAIETIMSQASVSLNAAVESASAAIYGTPKGRVEDATESAASAYSSIQSRASVAIYGTAQASASFLDVASSAQAAISEAIFGTPTATRLIVAATDGAGSVYSSISSVASEKAADTVSAISSALYGPEQGAMESASSRMAAAVEAANSKIAEMYASASKSAENVASGVASVVTEATQRVKDEL
ncbi:hypothetical protein P154DRAFT_63512 [Amniculicola lignicola CBS 123094]|uniref:Transcription factor hoxa13 n=1 Tax=Amniculicola lignicola CBS 123094 TaxID=1392246 RepID=A0A6A5WSM3_9PLEO|nr:hypothetical protein P154DRAFT_63512 [Amniculicola lignicola CBS 123094]